MTSDHINLVQRSFRLVEPILDTAVTLFYDRLFEIDPSLRTLFQGSREDQARKLAQTLTVVVKGIDRPEQIRAAVRALGSRHVGYGVRDEHYGTVGTALLWTLEAGLGDAFTPDVRQARNAMYAWLAFNMHQATALSAAADTTQPSALASSIA